MKRAPRGFPERKDAVSAGQQGRPGGRADRDGPEENPGGLVRQPQDGAGHGRRGRAVWRHSEKSGVRHTALWLNAKGIEKAAATAGVDLDGKMMLYASEAFSWSNNGCSAKDQQQRQLEWLAIYDRLNLPLEAVYVATAFGCQMQGEVPLQAVLDIVDFVRDLCAEQSRPCPAFSWATPWAGATPREIKRRVNAVRERAPGMRVGLHLHDTRGMGAANFYAALQEGVDLFDSSIGGLGGCPFCNHANMQAAGNICTEDMVRCATSWASRRASTWTGSSRHRAWPRRSSGVPWRARSCTAIRWMPSAAALRQPRRGAGMSDALLFSVDDGSPR